MNDERDDKIMDLEAREAEEISRAVVTEEEEVNYYNDNDPRICEWARSLIAAGLVPSGFVDCRPIQ